MRNVHWTIKYDTGFLWPNCHYLRRDAIAEYLAKYQNGTWAGKSWRWHK